MFKVFAVEFLITAPLLIVVSFICVHLLKKELRFESANKVAGVLALGLILTLVIARAMPFVAFKISPVADPTAQQTALLQKKNEFLKVVDEMMADASKITPENKKALFEHFKELFPRGAADKTVYLQSLSTFVDCNAAYFEDALQALKTKKPQKSTKRSQCTEVDGAFFNRAKMIPEDQAKLNDQVIETIAKGKKIIENDKEIPISEGSLKQALEAQLRSKESLQVLFAGETQ